MIRLSGFPRAHNVEPARPRPNEQPGGSRGQPTVQDTRAAVTRHVGMRQPVPYFQLLVVFMRFDRGHLTGSSSISVAVKAYFIR
jgi:hypothetical protein